MSRDSIDRLWAADFPHGEDSGVPTATTSLFCPSPCPAALSPVSGTCRREALGKHYTSHLSWPNMSSVPDLSYPSCQGANSTHSNLATQHRERAQLWAHRVG